MTSTRNVSASGPKPYIGRQLIRSGLPILVTIILIILLSGGFPPTTWLTFFRTCAQLKTLLLKQGSGVFTQLFILLLQSLALLAAWALCVWAMIREGAYLLEMWSSAKNSHLIATLSQQIDKHVQNRSSKDLSKSSLVLHNAAGEADIHKNPFEEDDASDDAFAMTLDDLDALPQADDQAGKGEKPAFVFGNPFEGPLPDVFDYDVDLKRSLAEIEQEEKEAKAASAKPAPDKPDKQNDDLDWLV